MAKSVNKESVLYLYRELLRNARPLMKRFRNKNEPGKRISRSFEDNARKDLITRIMKQAVLAEIRPNLESLSFFQTDPGNKLSSNHLLYSEDFYDRLSKNTSAALKEAFRVGTSEDLDIYVSLLEKINRYTRATRLLQTVMKKSPSSLDLVSSSTLLHNLHTSSPKSNDNKHQFHEKIISQIDNNLFKEKDFYIISEKKRLIALLEGIDQAIQKIEQLYRPKGTKTAIFLNEIYDLNNPLHDCWDITYLKLFSAIFDELNKRYNFTIETRIITNDNFYALIAFIKGSKPHVHNKSNAEHSKLRKMDRASATKFNPNHLEKDWVCVTDGSINHYISLKYDKKSHSLIARNYESNKKEWIMNIPQHANTITFNDGTSKEVVSYEGKRGMKEESIRVNFHKSSSIYQQINDLPNHFKLSLFTITVTKDSKKYYYIPFQQLDKCLVYGSITKEPELGKVGMKLLSPFEWLNGR